MLISVLCLLILVYSTVSKSTAFAKFSTPNEPSATRDIFQYFLPALWESLISFLLGLGVSNYNKETAAALERTWKDQMADYKETIIAAPKDSGEFWEIVEYYGTPQEGTYNLELLLDTKRYHQITVQTL